MSEPDKIADYFTRSALKFDSLYSEKRMSPLMRFANRRFRRDIYERYSLSLEHVQQYHARTVIDIGCGSGRYALGLAEVGVERILGIDLSPRMIELATEHIKEAQEHDEVFEFVCGDFMKFETKETYDVVVAMGFFDYVNEPVDVLKKMRELSNHSVVASFPSVSIYRTPLRKIRYLLKRCPVYFYKPAMIQSFADKAKFAACKVTKIEGAGMDYFVTFFK